MGKKFYILPQGHIENALTTRLGANAADAYTDVEIGKFAKLIGESAYGLAAVGNEIEAAVLAVELATQDGFTIGSVSNGSGYMQVTFDGLQGTPGTGAVAIGDYVVVGTAVAKGTAMPGYPKVCKATAASTGLTFKWRVVSLGTAGTGAVGTVGVIQRVL